MQTSSQLRHCLSVRPCSALPTPDAHALSKWDLPRGGTACENKIMELDTDKLKRSLVGVMQYNDAALDGQLQRKDAIGQCYTAVGVIDAMSARGRLNETDLYMGLRLAKTLSQQLKLEFAVVKHHRQWSEDADRACRDFCAEVAELERRHREWQQRCVRPSHPQTVRQRWNIDDTTAYRIVLDVSETEVSCVSATEVLTADGF
ncbi:unnamed protein product [Fusarium langsethiae]|nr:unnamed protein product [Fusarium langsethiae]